MSFDVIDKAFANKDRSDRAKLRAALVRLVESIDALISDSHGVTGLHRNGDIATWDELLDGANGMREWLGDPMDEARAALDATS